MKKIITVLLVLLVVLSGCSSKKDSYLKVEGVVEKIENKDNFVLYFTSPQCRVCQVFSPVYNEVAKEVENTFYTLDILDQKNNNNDNLIKLMTDHTGIINATPTIVVIKDGKVEASFMGALKYQELINIIDNFNLNE